jgi:hypothetical protein
MYGADGTPPLPVSICSDLEHPLLHGQPHHRMVASFALAVNDLQAPVTPTHHTAPGQQLEPAGGRGRESGRETTMLSSFGIMPNKPLDSQGL